MTEPPLQPQPNAALTLRSPSKSGWITISGKAWLSPGEADFFASADIEREQGTRPAQLWSWFAKVSSVSARPTWNLTYWQSAPPISAATPVGDAWSFTTAGVLDAPYGRVMICDSNEGLTSPDGVAVNTRRVNIRISISDQDRATQLEQSWYERVAEGAADAADPPRDIEFIDIQLWPAED